MNETIFYKSGNAMDEHGRGGFRAIWAEQPVELGADEGLPQIQEQIFNALNAFCGALQHSTLDDFSRKATFRGQQHFEGSLAAVILRAQLSPQQTISVTYCFHVGGMFLAGKMLERLPR